jgi:uncharacterized protein (DUF302 family)
MTAEITAVRQNVRRNRMSLQVEQSPHSVAVTIDRLVATLKERGTTAFARVDHAGGARGVGLELPDEELWIVGDPRAGTLLMQADAQVGYDLPLRILAWDAEGHTLVGYRTPGELAERYALSERAELLERMTGMLEELVAKITAP